MAGGLIKWERKPLGYVALYREGKKGWMEEHGHEHEHEHENEDEDDGVSE